MQALGTKVDSALEAFDIARGAYNTLPNETTRKQCSDAWNVFWKAYTDYWWQYTFRPEYLNHENHRQKLNGYIYVIKAAHSAGYDALS